MHPIELKNGGFSIQSVCRESITSQMETILPFVGVDSTENTW